MSLTAAAARRPLGAGTRLGPYELLELLGAGGMGEVYRAHDPRLGRDVALKVLAPGPGMTEERLRRFEQEARAAGALSHPNLVSVFDTGRHDGAPYLVFELLEGASLRARLGAGALPLRKVIDYGVQVAQGLAAAHDKGIVHRDLKPENIFVTADGRIKILDFGLAKLRPELDPDTTRANGTTPEETLTKDGLVFGTAAYMSPEQVRGKPADARSDVFSLGAVVYEMLSGRPAFNGDTAAETMAAILKTDPPALSAVPAGLDALVRRCLEKDTAERFQSARDVAFALPAVVTNNGAAAPSPTPGRSRWVYRVAAGTLATMVLAGGWALGRWNARPEPPSFTQLTFSRGIIQSARFAPDGQTLVYGAGWEGQPSRLFIGRTDSLESRPLDLPEGDILSISRNGEMAILLGRFISGRGPGTLARVSLAGGAPRELAVGVTQADWSPDGQELAIVRRVGGLNQLEFPIGKVLHSGMILLFPVVSPDGKQVAFLDYSADGGVVSVVDRDGRLTKLAKSPWPFGLAWSPRGDELWYSESGSPFTARQGTIHALDMRGRRRVLARLPGPVTLNDVSREGRALLTVAQWRFGLAAMPPGETREKDLSWFDGAVLAALATDGRTVLFSDRGGVYLRRTDGSPAVRLGLGNALDLSPDGKWALANTHGNTTTLVLLPTGAGETRPVPFGTLEALGGGFFPDGHRIYINARDGNQVRVYVQGLSGQARRAITPVGYGADANAVSPDGKRIVVSDAEGRLFIAPVDGGELQPLPLDQPVGSTLDHKSARAHWSADGRYLYVTNGLTELPIGVERPTPLLIDRVDVRTGARQPWRQVAIPDPAGLSGAVSFLMTPDQRSYAYSYSRILCTLHLVDGLR